MTDPHSSNDIDPNGIAGSGIAGSGGDLSGVDLGRVWTGVAAEVWRRQPGPVERLAARLLRSPGLARALLTTPSLLRPWLISTVVVFGVGGLINIAGGQPLVWALAPAIAAIGIAYAYGPGVDPAWELACSVPVSDRMVLLVRAVAVFAVNAFLGLLVSATSYSAISYKVAAHGAIATAAAASAEVTVAWLLPMTAVCALTLAVAVTTRSAGGGSLAGVLAWAATVIASGVAHGDFTAAVTDTTTYLPYLAVAACATAVIRYATRNQRGVQ
jgi:hypothetical protein